MAYLGFCPPGVVFPYAGSTAPEGWLLCNGQAISRTVYADLFAAIGVAHGYGDNSTTFNIPDYRGRFLRGRDGGIARDPDRAARTASNTGGNTGDNVGSVQVNATAKNGLSNNPSSISALTLNSSGITSLSLNSSGLSGTSGAMSANATHNHTYVRNLSSLNAAAGGNLRSADNENINTSDATLSHTHAVNGTAAAQTLVSGTAAAQTLSSGTVAAQVINNGDNETRPVNINVNYIIKI